MFKRLVPLLFACLGGAGLSQFPEFAQQYTQRVGGAYIELKDVVDGFRQDAANNGKTIDQAIATYAGSDDQFFKDRGKSMEVALVREAYLQSHYRALTATGLFAQLRAFVREPDRKIVQETYEIYKPAVPLTSVGAMHAALGFIAGYLLLGLPGMVLRRRRKPAAKAVRRS